MIQYIIIKKGEKLTKKEKIKFLQEQNEFLKVKALEAINLKIENDKLKDEIEELEECLYEQKVVIGYLENRDV